MKKKRPPKKTRSSRVVLVRTYAAGVHVGTLVSQKGQQVELRDATRVWRWRGANTLHELSQKGGDDTWTRISEPVPSLTLLDAVEIIPCSVVAADNLSKSRWSV